MAFVTRADAPERTTDVITLDIRDLKQTVGCGVGAGERRRHRGCAMRRGTGACCTRRDVARRARVSDARGMCAESRVTRIAVEADG